MFKLVAQESEKTDNADDEKKDECNTCKSDQEVVFIQVSTSTMY